MDFLIPKIMFFKVALHFPESVRFHNVRILQAMKKTINLLLPNFYNYGSFSTIPAFPVFTRSPSREIMAVIAVSPVQ